MTPFPLSGLLVAVAVLVDVTSLRQSSLMVQSERKLQLNKERREKQVRFRQHALFILIGEIKKKKKAKSNSLQLMYCGEPGPATSGNSPGLTGTLLLPGLYY